MIEITRQAWIDFMVKADNSDLKLGQSFCNEFNTTDDELCNLESRGKIIQRIFQKHIELKDKFVRKV